eukprot:COSAG01_NODE_3133_length_6533_cov_117.587842_4_plen_156_part_00
MPPPRLRNGCVRGWATGLVVTPETDCSPRAAQHKDRSTLLQILMSIQGTIMGVEKPMYLEPGYERGEGSEASEQRSAEYNDNLHYNTMRYAMLGALKNPPRGFEEVVHGHFSILKDVVLAQCCKWVANATSQENRSKMSEVAEMLRAELEKLPTQ